MTPTREQMEETKKRIRKLLITYPDKYIDNTPNREYEALNIALSCLNALLDAGEVFFNKLNYADYEHFEKYTECEHKKTDTIGGNCQACDTAWLIGRCKALEKARSEDIAIVAKLKCKHCGKGIL